MIREYTIQQAAELTGLTAYVIRAWERRYAVLKPHRTPSNRRLYSDADIEKLSMLRKAVEAGHTIGRIAGLSDAALESLVPDISAKVEQPETPDPLPRGDMADGAPGTPEFLLRHCLSMAEQLDVEGFETGLAQAASQLGTTAMVDQVVIPLLEQLGGGWRAGHVRIASEHMATVVLRTYLMRTFGAFQPAAPAPTLVVTTPAGQHHEFGALVAAVTAVAQGWRVLYLGPNLPAEEIAGAAHRSMAKAVALSIVYPPDDPGLPDELITLRRSLGPDMPVLVGGRDSAAYRDTLARIHALVPADLNGLRAVLATLRTADTH